MTSRYAVLGDPIEHSLSPRMHNAAFDALGLDGRYERLRVPAGQAEETLRRLHAEGYEGLNITVPLKVEVLEALEREGEVDAIAKRVGAVNTLVRTARGWYGTNTDAAGFVSALPSQVAAHAHAHALVLGAGGAARAVCVGLLDAGWTVEVSARRAEAAAALRSLGAQTRPWSPVLDAPLVVNATSASLHDGESFARGFQWELQPNAHVVDLVYGENLAFLRIARDEGASVQDGEGMLVHQGALAFSAWTGRDAPLDAMTRALRA